MTPPGVLQSWRSVAASVAARAAGRRSSRSVRRRRASRARAQSGTGHDDEMHPNTARCAVAAGHDLGVEVSVHSFPEGTKTAADAAAAIGVEGRPDREVARLHDRRRPGARAGERMRTSSTRRARGRGRWRSASGPMPTRREATGLSDRWRPSVRAQRTRCGSSSIPTCSTTTRCGRLRARGTTCSPSSRTPSMKATNGVVADIKQR